MQRAVSAPTEGRVGRLSKTAGVSKRDTDCCEVRVVDELVCLTSEVEPRKKRIVRAGPRTHSLASLPSFTRVFDSHFFYTRL